MSKQNTDSNANTENHDGIKPESNTEIEILTAKEFSLTLKLAGFSHNEFAERIHRSKSLVGAMCRGERTIDLRFQAELKSFLGHNLFAEALRHARTKIEALESRYKEDLLEQERRKAERIRQQEEHERTIREQRLEQLKRNGIDSEE